MTHDHRYPTTDAEITAILTLAQRWHSAIQDPQIINSAPKRMQACANAGNYYVWATLLQALHNLDPARAEEVRLQIADDIWDGAAIGENLWERLTELGVDPDTIAPATFPAEALHEADQLRPIAEAAKAVDHTWRYENGTGTRVIDPLRRLALAIDRSQPTDRPTAERKD